MILGDHMAVHLVHINSCWGIFPLDTLALDRLAVMTSMSVLSTMVAASTCPLASILLDLAIALAALLDTLALEI